MTRAPLRSPTIRNRSSVSRNRTGGPGHAAVGRAHSPRAAVRPAGPLPLVVVGATGALGRVAWHALAEAGARLTLTGGNLTPSRRSPPSFVLEADVITVGRRPDTPERRRGDRRGRRSSRTPGGRAGHGRHEPRRADHRHGRRGLRQGDGRQRPRIVAGVPGRRDAAPRAGAGAAASCSSPRRAASSATRPATAPTARRRRRSTCWPRRWRRSGARRGIRVNALAPDRLPVRADRMDVCRRREGHRDPRGDVRPDPAGPLRRAGRLRRRARSTCSATRRASSPARSCTWTAGTPHADVGSAGGFARAAVVGAGLMGRRHRGVLASVRARCRALPTPARGARRRSRRGWPR